MKGKVILLVIGAALGLLASQAWAKTLKEDKAREKVRKSIQDRVAEQARSRAQFGFVHISSCKRVGSSDHKVRCGVTSGEAITFNPANFSGTYEVKMKHESNVFGQTSYPISVRYCSQNPNLPETASC